MLFDFPSRVNFTHLKGSNLDFEPELGLDHKSDWIFEMTVLLFQQSQFDPLKEKSD